MSILKGACIIGQSGGPTSVINASAYGAIKTALESDCITRVLGAVNGIKGVLDDNLIDMSKEDPKELGYMKYTPSSALGSCRYKLKDPDVDDTDYKRILEIFRKYDVRYFFYNGGNDSMDTCNKISKYMLKNGYECRCMGIPKTIDNDLYGTDHCPGYGSATKYIATSVMEIYHDARVYDTGMVTVIELMGRNAGWLTAAAALAGYKGNGPDLIYLPELPFDLESFLSKVDEIYKKNTKCIVCVSEGIKDKDGKYISEYGADLAQSKDSFGHAQLGGLASYLAGVVKERTGAKVRGIELSLLQRCAAHCASKTDIDESFAAGKAAVDYATGGMTDKMIGFERTIENGKYVCNIKLFDLTVVANTEKKVPLDWINETGDGLNEKFIEYALPLIQGETELPKEDGLPRFVRLKTVCSGDIVNYFLHLTVWAIVFFTGRLCNNFPLRVIICFDSRLYSIGITVLDNLTRFSRNHNALVTIGCFFGHASIRIVVYIQLPDLLSSLVVVKGSGIQLSAGAIAVVNILCQNISVGFIRHRIK